MSTQFCLLVFLLFFVPKLCTVLDARFFCLLWYSFLPDVISSTITQMFLFELKFNQKWSVFPAQLMCLLLDQQVIVKKYFCFGPNFNMSSLCCHTAPPGLEKRSWEEKSGICAILHSSVWKMASSCTGGGWKNYKWMCCSYHIWKFLVPASLNEN